MEGVTKWGWYGNKSLAALKHRCGVTRASAAWGKGLQEANCVEVWGHKATFLAIGTSALLHTPPPPPRGLARTSYLLAEDLPEDLEPNSAERQNMKSGVPRWDGNGASDFEHYSTSTPPPTFGWYQHCLTFGIGWSLSSSFSPLDNETFDLCNMVKLFWKAHLDWFMYCDFHVVIFAF